MKTLKIKLAALVVAILSCTAFASAQTVTPAYTASVKQIVEMTGGKETIVNVTAPAYAQMGLMSESTARVAVNEWLAASWDDIIDIYTQVYVKYFTQEDLNNIIAFYNTPSGKKFAIHSTDFATEAQTLMLSNPKVVNSLQTIIMKYAK